MAEAGTQVSLRRRNTTPIKTLVDASADNVAIKTTTITTAITTNKINFHTVIAISVEVARHGVIDV